MYKDTFLPELQLRWDKIQSGMSVQNAEALLVSSNSNLFYISGRIFSGYAYFPKGEEPFFFVRRPVGLTGNRVIYIRKPEQMADFLLKEYGKLPQSLLIESDTVTYNESLRYKNIFSGVDLHDGSAVLRDARTLKTAYEIDQIRRSGIHHDAAYKRIPSVYVEGMTDLEFSIELERLCRQNGSLGMVRIAGSSMEIFMGSVLVGDNADQPSPYDFAMGGAGLNSSLPVGCNGSVIKPGQTVMVDLGGNFTGYMTDMSRVFSLGEISDQAQIAHRVSLQIQSTIELMARPGVATADLYNRAIEIADHHGLGAYFMGHRQQSGFIGHGVGIELNEVPVLAPRSKDILAEGMVFALEPKFVIPHVGAVGIENTFVVTAMGVEKVTHAPEDILSLL